MLDLVARRRVNSTPVCRGGEGGKPLPGQRLRYAVVVRDGFIHGKLLFYFGG
jgi:hypothetical protein